VDFAFHHHRFFFLSGSLPEHLIHPSGASEKQGNSVVFFLSVPIGFGLPVGSERAFMGLWLTATERRKIMKTAVLMEIEKLRRASLSALRQKYREVFGEETPCRHRQHLFRRIAWRLQALAEGDLSERARQRAGEIARDADLRIVAPQGFFNQGGRSIELVPGEGGRRQQDSRLPLPGTVLSREWKGQTVLVEVLAEGFRFENRYYPSLSAIAVAVTGTRWNGLAFFRLTGKEATREKQ
jgi:hypothetical protein